MIFRSPPPSRPPPAKSEGSTSIILPSPLWTLFTVIENLPPPLFFVILANSKPNLMIHRHAYLYLTNNFIFNVSSKKSVLPIFSWQTFFFTENFDSRNLEKFRYVWRYHRSSGRQNFQWKKMCKLKKHETADPSADVRCRLRRPISPVEYVFKSYLTTFHQNMWINVACILRRALDAWNCTNGPIPLC